ncbi:MAG: DUF2877 domain-containing protein [Rhodoglobus sp.]
MVATIAAPVRARIDASLDGDFAARAQQIVHLGQSAVVLHPNGATADEPWLLTITDGAGGVTPGGISIPSPVAFARVRGEFAFAGLGATVDLSAWASCRELVPVELRLAPRDFDSGAIRAVSAALVGALPTTSTAFDGGLERVRSRAGDLAAASLALDPGPVVADLIGAGPGTTPTGDDMVVGCLAALAVLDRPDAASALSAAVAPLLAATTTTSRHYLAAAASGRFAEHVNELVAGFATGHAADQLVAHARRWGATSGVDLLIGLAATLRADLVARTVARTVKGVA